MLCLRSLSRDGSGAGKEQQWCAAPWDQSLELTLDVWAPRPQEPQVTGAQPLTLPSLTYIPYPGNVFYLKVK